ncbi:phytanoyl-CoA dioxygenase [Caballeronia arationis]|jgi:ectoine hydroxylase-related dioxygenase (phytanoyl-CoA dioxygenase family)|uniref:Ectoine hydroxylase-related dioxygenase, phytanoyl-CoA dioxygenase (PhyH) family n=1 Tax=Caballeronia arationis TaxID=1777142 RepID=A0A7Z7N0V2_9BURK|nr:phytanoyl-CoA dioxygenase family protein [Caballeronia arationis]SAK91943.1 phytanoyl-CoA dioxygenase [Caballeronia arationis]SOE55265.1 Ectoine hydroxylase-related dioxygenase, phytanoyl-CoA dioxygenase (PhyH) family [Caballeronia arationis]
MITDQQARFYADNGYLIVEELFEREKIHHALAAIDELLNPSNSDKPYEFEPRDGTTVRRIWSPTKKHQMFRQMASDPLLLDCIERLIGGNILFHYSKLNMKGPRVGSVVEWHQDFSYYPHTNADLLSALVFLDDASTQNGCLRVVPGSHRGGLRSHDVDGFFRGKVQGIDEASAVNIEVPAGSVVFLHCLTLHASARNESNLPRRTFLPAYRAADAFPIYFGPHAAHNEPGIELLRGRRAKVARVEAGVHSLPIAEREFGSLYELQEGSHLRKDLSAMTTAGYAVADAAAH